MDLEIVMSPVQNDSGQVIGISTIARNITDRKRRELNLAFLADVNRDFAPLLSVDELMKLVGERVAEYLRLSRCHISLINEEADQLEVIYEWRRDATWESLLGVNRLSDNFTEEGRQYYRNGKVAIINGLEDNPLINTSKWKKLSGVGSIIEMPLQHKGEWSFLITVVRSEVREWRQDEVDLVREVALIIYTRVERSRAESVIRRSEEKFRTLTDAIPQVIWTNDAHGKANYFNERWYEYTGLSYDESYGLGWKACVHPDDAPESKKKWNKAQKDGKVFDTEYRLRRYDGSYRWFIGRNVPMLDEAGKVVS
jgi:PAS domain S-box-containing protein